MEDSIIKDLEVKKALKLIKKNLAKKYNLKKIPSNIELLNYLSVKPKEIITKPTRTISGVAPIAVMTKPSKCPHVKSGLGPCIMCPGGPKSYYGNVPQSYTGKEPATMRAIRNKFDPYLQVFNRLEQYVLLNQNFDKAEIIIMGGTFPSLNKKYQGEFVMYIFKALNDFSNLFFREKFDFVKFKEFFELPGDKNDKNRTKNIHLKLLKLKKKSSLEKEQLRNEKAKIRCVGLTIETRSDYATLREGNFLLNLGATRIELGLQSIYNDVLKKINRGHTAEDTIKAIRTLKDLGFKINLHVILGLPNSNKCRDIKMLKELFENQDFRPDMLKIYPCMVLKGTKLYDLWKTGKYKAITTKQAIDIICELKRFIPEYCRIMRIQRDIPTYVSEAGVDRTNLRQYIHEVCKIKNIKCKCIRCREIKDENIKNPKLKVIEYKASNGKEFFISLNSEDKLIGFCRLRFPSQILRKEITKNSVLIRELHVYGKAIGVGEKGGMQHKGYGSFLINEVEKIAKQYNKNKIIIISGVGVREYFRRMNYRKEGPYMTKLLSSK